MPRLFVHASVPRVLTIGIMMGFSLMHGDSTKPAFACSCASDRSTNEAFDSSEAVFSGEVTRIDADQFGKTAVFHVETVWKGVSEDTVSISTAAHSAACGYEFEEGKSYIVFAYGESDSSLKTNLCSGTSSDESMLRHIEIFGAGYVPVSTPIDLDIADSNVGPLPAIFGMGAAVAAVIAFLTLRRKS